MCSRAFAEKKKTYDITKNSRYIRIDFDLLGPDPVITRICLYLPPGETASNSDIPDCRVRPFWGARGLTGLNAWGLPSSGTTNPRYMRSLTVWHGGHAACFSLWLGKCHGLGRGEEVIFFEVTYPHYLRTLLLLLHLNHLFYTYLYQNQQPPIRSSCIVCSDKFAYFWAGPLDFYLGLEMFMIFRCPATE